MSAEATLRTANRATESGPRLAVTRGWLVSDAWVSSQLMACPIVPITDKPLLRYARVVAFVLGVQALPKAGAGSIVQVSLSLDPGERSQLARRLSLSSSVVDEAVRHLLLAGILEPVRDEPHSASFVQSAVTNSPLASAIYWPAVVDRLLSPPREGSQTALMVFRILADRVPHPEAPVALSLRELGDELGLGEAQIRRGMKALVAAQCCSETAVNGRAKLYAIHPSLLWRPAVGETIAIASQVPPVPPQTSPSPPLPTEGPQHGDVEATGASRPVSGEPDWVLTIPRGMQFTLPQTAGAVDLTIDAAGHLIVQLRAGPTAQ